MYSGSSERGSTCYPPTIGCQNKRKQYLLFRTFSNGQQILKHINGFGRLIQVVLQLAIAHVLFGNSQSPERSQQQKKSEYFRVDSEISEWKSEISSYEAIPRPLWAKTYLESADFLTNIGNAIKIGSELEIALVCDITYRTRSGSANASTTYVSFSRM